MNESWKREMCHVLVDSQDFIKVVTWIAREFAVVESNLRS